MNILRIVTVYGQIRYMRKDDFDKKNPFKKICKKSGEYFNDEWNKKGNCPPRFIHSDNIVGIKELA